MNYDLSNFHRSCTNKQFGFGTDGHMYVICLDCQVVADVEAVSAKVSPKDVCTAKSADRIPTGKQSAGIDKGGVIK